MLDFPGVNTLRLQFPNGERDDLVLGPGVHAIGHDADGRPCLVDRPDQARMQISIDRRGSWLQLREGAHGLHVNGRPVRRMAMLRAGDAVHMDEVELLLVGARPEPLSPLPTALPAVLRHMVLRAIGGTHHGRCFDLDAPCVVGRLADSEVCIPERDFPDQHSRLEPEANGISVRNLDGATDLVINGHPVSGGLLLPGDQLVFGRTHRFVVEAPQVAASPMAQMSEDGTELPVPEVIEPSRSPLMRSLRRMPWLLLAALLLAGALALLLLYGVR